MHNFCSQNHWGYEKYPFNFLRITDFSKVFLKKSCTIGHNKCHKLHTTEHLKELETTDMDIAVKHLFKYFLYFSFKLIEILLRTKNLM